jgi:hypothetical protein
VRAGVILNVVSILLIAMLSKWITPLIFGNG